MRRLFRRRQQDSRDDNATVKSGKTPSEGEKKPVGTRQRYAASFSAAKTARHGIIGVLRPLRFEERIKTATGQCSLQTRLQVNRPVAAGNPPPGQLGRGGAAKEIHPGKTKRQRGRHAVDCGLVWPAHCRVELACIAQGQGIFRGRRRPMLQPRDMDRRPARHRLLRGRIGGAQLQSSDR